MRPSKSAVLDSNLVVLLVAGKVDRSLVGRHRRLRSFQASDYDLLLSILRNYGKPILTPNVLSEASNLLRYDAAGYSDGFHRTFRELMDLSDEVYIRSIEATARVEHRRLGLTDSVLLMLAVDGHDLITDDLQLYLAAEAAGCRIINLPMPGPAA